MKKGFLFTTALAMVLGVGVAVGAHQSQRVEKADAAENVTLYCKMQYDWWWAKGGLDESESAGIGVHYWDESTTTDWPGVRGTKLEADPTVWKFEVPSDSDGFIFTRVNTEGNIDYWGAQTDNLTFPTDGKNLYTITSSSEAWGDNHVTGVWGNLYTVTTHVRGETEVVSVVEGGLPANPSLAFGEQSFDGWFDNEECTEGHEVTAITSDQTVYAKITSYATKTYTLDTSRVSTVFTSKKLYAFDSHGNNGEFPGVAIDSDTFSVPSSAAIVISNGNGAQTVDITQSGVDNDVLIILNEQNGEGKYNILWESANDEPEEDGYYLVGSKTNYKFAGAAKLSTTDLEPGNIAELHGYEGKKDEIIKVRSFFNEEATWSFYNGGEKDFGAGDQYANFVFSKDQKVNIYAKYEGNPSQLYFYVEEFHERYEVTLTKVLLAGARWIGEAEGGSVYAYNNEAFDPTTKFAPTHDGYVFRGKYYTDEDCTIEYVSAVPTADLHLYALFTKVGYYVISGAGYWSIDNAILMDSPDNPNNKAEASIKVYNVGDTYSFVYYDGEMHGHAGLGDEYEFVVNEEDHIKFTKAGNYAVYWSKGDNKLYINAGLEAFYTNFLNSVGGACHSNGIYAEGELQAVKDAWDLQEAAYNALTTEEQNTIKAIGFDTDSESQDQSVRMVKMYSYIVKKYGTAVFNDFIWNQNYTGEHSQVLVKVSNVESGATAIIVIAPATVSALACGMLLLFKKKKQK